MAHVDDMMIAAKPEVMIEIVKRVNTLFKIKWAERPRLSVRTDGPSSWEESGDVMDAASVYEYHRTTCRVCSRSSIWRSARRR